MLRKYVYTAGIGLALVAANVGAESVTVNVSATVMNVYDNANALNGQMKTGDVITGTYTFETTTLDQNPTIEVGSYVHQQGTGGISLTVNGLNLATVPAAPEGAYLIDVTNFPSSDFYHVMSHQNQTLSTGARLDYLAIDLMDNTGLAHSSDALLNTAPDLAAYQFTEIHGLGQSADGLNGFDFSAQINSIEIADVLPPGAYKLTAIVRDVYDPNNLLQGKVKIGDDISGTYAVDLNAPDNDTNPNHAYYNIPADLKYGFDLNVRDTNFKSDSLFNMSEVHIQNDFSDHYHVVGRPGMTSDSTINVDEIAIYLDDPTGLALSSTAQPTDSFNIAAFQIKDLFISGAGSTGGYYYIVSEIMSIHTGSIPETIVSPATDSVFIPYQRFDMAIILPAQSGARPIGLSGKVNNMNHPYFSSVCRPSIMTRDNHYTMLCRDADQVLVPGVSKIDLTIDMDDGTRLPVHVEWIFKD